jgi:hypothetical protein
MKAGNGWQLRRTETGALVMRLVFQVFARSLRDGRLTIGHG